jgi:hypothetical protein
LRFTRSLATSRAGDVPLQPFEFLALMRTRAQCGSEHETRRGNDPDLPSTHWRPLLAGPDGIGMVGVIAGTMLMKVSAFMSASPYL